MKRKDDCLILPCIIKYFVFQQKDGSKWMITLLATNVLVQDAFILCITVFLTYHRTLLSFTPPLETCCCTDFYLLRWDHFPHLSSLNLRSNRRRSLQLKWINTEGCTSCQHRPRTQNTTAGASTHFIKCTGAGR